MKKYRIIVCLIATLLLLIPINIYGKNVIKFDCDSNEIGVNEKVACNIVADTEYDIGSYEFELDKTSGIKVKDFTASSGWVSESGDSKYGAINASGAKSGSIIGTITFLNSGEGNSKNIVVKNIQLGLINTSGDVETVEPEDTEIGVAITNSGSNKVSGSNLTKTALPIGIGVVVVVGIILVFVNKKKRK